MNYSKQILEITGILKNIFRYSMFNHKGSICITELNDYIRKLDILINCEFQYLFQNTVKYNFLKDVLPEIDSYLKNKKYFELAQTANNAYHKLSEISGKIIKEYDFQVLTADASEKPASLLKNKIALALDNIRSPFNVGAFFRTADAAGISSLYLAGMTPTPENPKVKRSSMQSDNYIKWQYFQYIEDAVEKLKNDGYYIISVETTNNAENYSELQNKNQDTAFVFGNEEFGINENILAASDKIIKIPMFGIKNSINVGVAAGIILFHFINSKKND